MSLRAEFKRKEKAGKKSKTVTYNYTEEQLHAVINEALDSIMSEREERYRNQAINTALLLLLSLPSEVLKEHYWPKTYAKKLPEFNQHVLDLYNKFVNDDLDIQKLKEDLWENAGIGFEEGELL